MKISVKTLRGNHFEIEAKSEDTVADVKKTIESAKGADVYPSTQQLLIYQGKVLKDDTTLEENKVAENSFIVIMLTKNKASSTEGSTTSSAPTAKGPQTSATPPITTPVSTTSQPAAAAPSPAPAPAPAPARVPTPADTVAQLAAINALSGRAAIQQLLDIGDGTWDRDTVVRALRVASFNPDRAVEYLYSGIPENLPPPNNVPIEHSASPTHVPSTGPNANPLNLFPQGMPSMDSNADGASTLDFLRTSPQFQVLRAMVQANPQILQPMLQELVKQNPQLVGLIQEHEADFLSLINEPMENENNISNEIIADMPQTVIVTPEDAAAIQRLEDMGFDHDHVMEVFFACGKIEELAANFLLDHMH